MICNGFLPFWCLVANSAVTVVAAPPLSALRGATALVDLTADLDGKMGRHFSEAGEKRKEPPGWLVSAT